MSHMKTPPNLQYAIRAVMERGVSLREAARTYGVEHSTISRRIREYTHGLRPSDNLPKCPHCHQPMPSSPPSEDESLDFLN